MQTESILEDEYQMQTESILEDEYQMQFTEEDEYNRILWRLENIVIYLFDDVNLDKIPERIFSELSCGEIEKLIGYYTYDILCKNELQYSNEFKQKIRSLNGRILLLTYRDNKKSQVLLLAKIREEMRNQQRDRYQMINNIMHTYEKLCETVLLPEYAIYLENITLETQYDDYEYLLTIYKSQETQFLLKLRFELFLQLSGFEL